MAAPYGSWPSPIGSDALVAGGLRLGAARFDGRSVVWQERRPSEGGRTALVRDGLDLLPAGFDVRTRVHEYGGGAWTLLGDAVVFSHDGDGRLYRRDPGGEPWPITPEPERPRALRYADLPPAPGRTEVLCLRDPH